MRSVTAYKVLVEGKSGCGAWETTATLRGAAIVCTFVDRLQMLPFLERLTTAPVKWRNEPMKSHTLNRTTNGGRL